MWLSLPLSLSLSLCPPRFLGPLFLFNLSYSPPLRRPYRTILGTVANSPTRPTRRRRSTRFSGGVGINSEIPFPGGVFFFSLDVTYTCCAMPSFTGESPPPDALRPSPFVSESDKQARTVVRFHDTNTTRVYRQHEN